MSKIKNGGLDHYGAGPLNSSNLEQLALKWLSNKLVSKLQCHHRLSTANYYTLFSSTAERLLINTFTVQFQLSQLVLDFVSNCFADHHLTFTTNAHSLIVVTQVQIMYASKYTFNVVSNYHS